MAGQHGCVCYGDAMAGHLDHWCFYLFICKGRATTVVYLVRQSLYGKLPGTCSKATHTNQTIEMASQNLMVLEMQKKKKRILRWGWTSSLPNACSVFSLLQQAHSRLLFETGKPVFRYVFGSGSSSPGDQADEQHNFVLASEPYKSEINRKFNWDKMSYIVQYHFGIKEKDAFTAG